MRRTSRIAATATWIALVLTAPALCIAADQDGWINLFNGKDLTGWKLVNPKGRNGWSVNNGVVISQTPSTNIVFDKQFRDFDLHCDYQVPKGSNAGIYIFQRYEVQIFDDYQKPIYSHMCGSMYGEITPKANACKPAAKEFPNIAEDEWQTFDIKFRTARYNAAGEKTDNVRVTVVHNGVTIIDNQELKTPTGAGRRLDEELQGPIMLQGDHGPVAFRNFRIRGQVYEPPDPKAPGPEVIGLSAKTLEMPNNQATGEALTWKTPGNAYASAYRVYRGPTADFPLDKDHLVVTALKRSYSDCSFPKDGTYFYRVVALGPDGVAGKPCADIRTEGKANQVKEADLSVASWARIEGENVPLRKTASRRPPLMHGRKFQSGIGIQGSTAIQMNVSELVGSSADYHLRATIGMDDSVPMRNREGAAVRFNVELDGKKAFDSGVMKWGDGTKDVDVAIPAGTKVLVLRTTRAGQSGGDNSNWAEPRLERTAR